jgi:protein TonB
MHLGVVAILLLLVRLHMPRRQQDAPVIAVIMETTPAGNTAAPVVQRPLVPPPPAPPHMAALPAPAVPPPPLAPVVDKSAALPPPLPAAPPPSRALETKPIVVPLLVQGTQVPGRKLGTQEILATRPAAADSGNAAPVYSLTARALGEQGQVFLRVLVLDNGVPGQVTVAKTSGFSMLDEAAVTAVRGWHFQPALKDGVPVASVMSYWFRFELH